MILRENNMKIVTVENTFDNVFSDQMTWYCQSLIYSEVYSKVWSFMNSFGLAREVIQKSTNNIFKRQTTT
jgi:hypothetical protein